MGDLENYVLKSECPNRPLLGEKKYDCIWKIIAYYDYKPVVYFYYSLMVEQLSYVSFHERFPITAISLGNDIYNGRILAGLISKNPEAVVALFVLPCSQDFGEKSNDDIQFDFGCILPAGQLAESADEILRIRPNFSTKYYMLTLLLTDPKMPTAGRLVIGATRFCNFEFAGNADYGKGRESDQTLRAMMDNCPDRHIYILETDDYWERYELVAHRLDWFIQRGLRLYIMNEKAYSELSFEL